MTRMKDYVRIATLDNEIEALLLESVLKEQGIPHRMQSFHDTAYDGLFQTQKGWGMVTAPDPWKGKVLEILEDLRVTREIDPDRDGG